MNGALLFFTLLWLIFLSGDGAGERVAQKGRIQGESYVNLRSGPDLSHPPKAVLREGQEIIVEREDKSWYLVSLSDGRQGYVHKSFVRLFEKVETREVPKEKSAPTPNREKQEALPVLPSQEMEKKAPRGKPMPLIKVLEGREGEILWWFGAVLCIFVIGWICGGNYYLYRDQIRRKKVRF